MDTKWSAFSIDELLAMLPNPFARFQTKNDDIDVEADSEIIVSKRSGTGFEKSSNTTTHATDDYFCGEHAELIKKITEKMAILKNREAFFRHELRKMDLDIQRIVHSSRSKIGLSDYDRSQIKGIMARKRMIAGQSDQCAKLRVTLESQLFNLENVSLHKTTNDAMKEVNKTMKEVMKGMSVRNVELTMEKTQQIHEDCEEITGIMGQGISTAYIDDTELDSMLDTFFSEEDYVCNVQHMQMKKAQELEYKTVGPSSSSKSSSNRENFENESTVDIRMFPSVPSQDSRLSHDCTEDDMADNELQKMASMLFS